ncbi:MAG: glycosyltransferase family 2 protein [Candidatus Vogelbacteria bacterium]|nr:glycosyltransferase family 2 protein [Candidatus Vogelbacteria bacterium]
MLEKTENKTPKLSIVLPCRNEAAALGACLEKIKKTLVDNNLTGEIIVSDSSTDGSDEVARRAGVRVVKHNQIGYGRAYLEGFKGATGEIIIMGDPDGSYDFTEIPNFLVALADKDLVVGSRFKGKMERGAMPWLHRYVGSPIILLLMRAFYGLKLSEPSTGFVAVRKDALDKLELKQPGMEFASEFLVEAKAKGLKMGEIPIDYHRRLGSSKLRVWRDGWRHLIFILKRRIVG